MEVSNPRDERAERNRGSAEVPLSTVIPRVGNFHLEQNTILDSFSCTTTPKIWFISRFCVFFSLGENTWVRCNFITQAKSVAISVWCARKSAPKPNAINPPTQLWFTLNLIKIGLLASEIFFFEIVDGRRRTTTTDDDNGRRMPAYPISSPVSLRLR